MRKKPIRKFIVTSLSIIILASIFTACDGNWFSAGEQNSQTEQTDVKEPIAPVVVDGVRTSYADIVQKTAPAVVQITAVGRQKVSTERTIPGLEDFFNQMPNAPRSESRPSRGFGSGVIVNQDGTILTNHHVIEDADKITVEMSDNSTYDAKVVGSDPPSDLAVIKIEGKEFPNLKLGDSDNVRIGDIVLAIGNPLDIGQTVTSGIISAKGRRTGLGDGSSFQDFLQTVLCPS